MPKSWHTRSEESDDLRDLLKAVMFQATVSQGNLAKVHSSFLLLFHFCSSTLQFFYSFFLSFPFFLSLFCLFIAIFYPPPHLHPLPHHLFQPFIFLLYYLLS